MYILHTEPPEILGSLLSECVDATVATKWFGMELAEDVLNHHGTGYDLSLRPFGIPCVENHTIWMGRKRITNFQYR